MARLRAQPTKHARTQPRHDAPELAKCLASMAKDGRREISEAAREAILADLPVACPGRRGQSITVSGRRGVTAGAVSLSLPAERTPRLAATKAIIPHRFASHHTRRPLRCL